MFNPREKDPAGMCEFEVRLRTNWTGLAPRRDEARLQQAFRLLKRLNDERGRWWHNFDEVIR